MKKYFKKFWVLYLVVILMLIVYLIAGGIGRATADSFSRTNSECLTTERVFDYADKLTDEEEDQLRELIALREGQIGCDIVLVVLEEPIGDSSTDLMKYADDFYDDNKFGYNKPWGDGVIYVDNWYSYGNYNGDVWMSTSGRAEERYSGAMISDLIEYACDVVNQNPYKAYERYVNQVYHDMSSKSSFLGEFLQPGTILIAAIIITAIYLFANLSGRNGKRTTTANTYVASTGQPALHNAQDIFITKNVTRRRIESSSGGGGGHHMSGGGHSHGGGGGHH